MTARSNPAVPWQAAALIGVLLIIVGIVPAYIEENSHFSSELFSKHYEHFLSLILIGVVVSSFGLVGWAKQVQRGTRVRMAVLVFIAPWIAALVAIQSRGIMYMARGRW